MPDVTPQTGVTLSQVGLYLQDQMSFGDGWHFTLAGRQDFAEQEMTDLTGSWASLTRSDQAFTWQAGLLYEFAAGIAPYVSYSTSFLPSSNVDAEGNLLQPSYGEQYEAGIKFQPKGGRSFFTMAAYQITQTNYAVPDPVSYVYSPVGDIPRARLRGRGAGGPRQRLRHDRRLHLHAGCHPVQRRPDHHRKTPVTCRRMSPRSGSNTASRTARWRASAPARASAMWASIGRITPTPTRTPPSSPWTRRSITTGRTGSSPSTPRTCFNQQEALQNEGYWYGSRAAPCF